MAINIGSPGELVSDKLNYANAQGQLREVVFEGSERFIRALYGDFVAQGYSVTCDIKPGKCSLTAKDDGAAGTNEIPTGIEVELQINTVHKSIYEPPAPHGFSLTVAQLARVQAMVQASSSREGLTTAEAEEVALQFTDDQYALYKLGVRKVEHRIVYQPILTRVTTAGRLYQFPANAHDGVGENYSEAAMLAELNVPLQFALPLFTDPVDADIYYGWVKRMPHYQQVAGQRVSETMSFEFGAWSIDLYPLVG